MTYLFLNRTRSAFLPLLTFVFSFLFLFSANKKKKKKVRVRKGKFHVEYIYCEGKKKASRERNLRFAPSRNNNKIIKKIIISVNLKPQFQPHSCFYAEKQQTHTHTLETSTLAARFGRHYCFTSSPDGEVRVYTTLSRKIRIIRPPENGWICGVSPALTLLNHPTSLAARQILQASSYPSSLTQEKRESIRKDQTGTHALILKR